MSGFFKEAPQSSESYLVANADRAEADRLLHTGRLLRTDRFKDNVSDLRFARDSTHDPHFSIDG